MPFSAPHVVAVDVEPNAVFAVEQGVHDGLLRWRRTLPNYLCPPGTGNPKPLPGLPVTG